MAGAPEQLSPASLGGNASAGIPLGVGGQQALHFHRTPAAAGAGGNGAGPPKRSSPGAGGRGAAQGPGERSLPHLPTKKTQAVFGAQLRQPGEVTPAGSSVSNALPALRGGGGAARLQRAHSGGAAWSLQGDRFSESRRDARMVAHMAAKWNKG